MAQAKSITVTSDGREQAAAAQQEASSSGALANVEEARAWIAAWRAKQGGSSAAAGAGAGVPPNVAEAREWIRTWRARQLEKRLPADSLSSK